MFIFGHLGRQSTESSQIHHNVQCRSSDKGPIKSNFDFTNSFTPHSIRRQSTADFSIILLLDLPLI